MTVKPVKTESFVFVPIGIKPYGVKHQLLIQRNKLRQQLEIAMEAMRSVSNDLSPWDKNGHILLQAIMDIKELDEN